MKVAIYPGSFDPITYGHMDIIDRACGLFDKVVIAIAKNDAKNPLFSLEDRIKLSKNIYQGNDQVEVVGFPRQLTVDVAKEQNACAIIRGLRASSYINS
jgi:pantetheine-phosphate adenylyltransferase